MRKWYPIILSLRFYDQRPQLKCGRFLVCSKYDASGFRKSQAALNLKSIQAKPLTCGATKDSHFITDFIDLHVERKCTLVFTFVGILSVKDHTSIIITN